MTTITAEELGERLTDKIIEAIKKGDLFITAGGRTLRVVEVEEPLTENGLTEREEEELKERWTKAQKDQEAGGLTRTNTPQEITALLESL